MSFEIKHLQESLSFLVKNGLRQEAVNLAESFSLNFKDSREFQLITAKTYLHTKFKKTEALSLISPLKKSENSNPDLLYLLAQAHRAKDEIFKAIEFVSKSIEIDSSNTEFLMERSMYLFEIGKYDDAKSDLDKVLKLDPKHVRARFNSGWFRIRDGELSEGIGDLASARGKVVWGSPQLHLKFPACTRKNIKNSRVAILCEAGLGDQMISARFVKTCLDLGAKSVDLICHKSLVSLFSIIDGVNRVIPFEERVESKDAFYLVCEESQAELGKIAAFRDWILALVEEEQDDV